MMKFILLLITFCLSISSYSATLKFGIASIVSPEESFNLYTDLNNYIAKRMGVRIQPVIKRDYDEMNRMILSREVDFASVCTGAIPYLNNGSVRVLAVPEINGKHSYKSLIITNKKYNIRTINDLRGKLFAFTDRLSNSGTLYPTYMIIQYFHKKPEDVLKKIFYTKSHDKSIFLVEQGVVQAAAVDSLIFNTIKAKHPDSVKNIKLLVASPDIISPPIVASSSLGNDKFIKLQKILLGMNSNADGRKILKNLNIDRFVKADMKDFYSVIEMKATVEKFNLKNTAN